MNILKKIIGIGVIPLVLMASLIIAPPQRAAAAVASDVTRSFSTATPTAGSVLTVSLSVNVVPPDTYYAIEEIVPAGWTVTSATVPGDFTTTPGRIFWVITGGAASTVLQYTVNVPSTATGVNVFSGTYGFDLNPTGTILGSTTVNVQPAAPVLTTINVTPAAPSVLIGATQQFTATTLDQNGAPIVATIAWTSSDMAVGTIDPVTGLFTAVGAGTVTITATSGAVTGTALATVIATLPTFTITSTAGANGAITPLGATVVNSGASQMFTITPSVGFTVQDVLVDGVSTGAVSTFTFTNVTANHTIDASFVAVPPATFTIISTAGANGSISPLGSSSYTTGASALYTITPSAGYVVQDVLVDGVSVGAVTTYTFTNVVANHTIDASFKLTPVITTLTVAPLASSVAAGATTQFTATTLDQYGAPIAATIAWSSDNVGVATVDGNGLASGVAAGTANISASSGGLIASAVLTVTPAPVLTTINVTPSTASVVSGGTQQFTATALDQFGAPIAATFTWSSDNLTVATVNASGLATTLAAGTANISAISGTITGTATLTVTPVPVLATINVVPSTASVVVGNNQQFTATTLDQFGAPIVAAVAWTSSDTAVATVDASGLVTTLATGTSTISAANGLVTGAALLTVTPVPVLTTINVTPVNPSVSIGATQQFAATTLDQFGAPIVAAVTWSSSSTTVATIDAGGLATMLALGTTTVTATSGAISGLTVLTVIPVQPILTTINVLPSSVVTMVGTTTQFTATTLDQYGAPIAATIAWSSASSTIGTINPASGLFTPVANGATIVSATSGNVVGTSSVSVIADTQSPTVPNNLVATVISSSQINLSWDASSDNVGVIGYKVYRNGTSTPIATPSGISFADTGLQASTVYVYTIRAFDLAGNMSDFATSTSATTPATPVVPPPSGGGGGGGYSGGGGGGVYPHTLAELMGGEKVDDNNTTTTQQKEESLGQVLGATAFNFTHDCYVGMKDADVIELQKRLTQEGVYSGPITGYFGSLTKAAAMKYQANNGISSTGYVGPLTRAALNGTSPSSSSVLGATAFNFSHDCYVGMKDADVVELQKRLTQEGVYSGPVTGYFGSLTRAAVMKYQANNGISSTGYVGPLTRAALNK